MRRPPLALFSGIGRRIALAAILCGLAVFVVGLLLQAGKQHRHFRETQQQMVRMAATQASRLLNSRLGNVENLFRVQVASATPGTAGDWTPLRTLLQQTPQFESVSILPPVAAASLQAGSRSFTLDDSQRDLLANGQSTLVSASGNDGVTHLYLLRELPEPAPARLVLAGLRDTWLWSTLLDETTAQGFAAYDAQGRYYFGTGEQHGDVAGLVGMHLQSPVAGARAAQPLAWTGGGEAWTGSLALVSGASAFAGLPLGILVMERERSWSVAFWSALRTQGTALPLLLLLAVWLSHRIAGTNVLTLRQLRRAISQLPDRRIGVSTVPGLGSEVRQLVEAWNRSAEALDSQNDTRRVLDEIDALLLPGGEFEGVLDQVLYRVRTVTRAAHVGLTLVDPGVAGHGRLFVVSAEGGAPVNRVVLDEEMVATLRDAEGGMTVVRCEEGRHSFLEPLQVAGSGFFWVWPVMAAGELAAILAVGFPEQPVRAAGIADTGTQCAQRLGLSLSSQARAERLYRQAHFDPLTQLPNRLLFRDELQQALRHAVRGETSGALLFIDLDHFKRVNDSLGHEAGDQLLSIFAQRLRACVKDDDTVARLGGDEFTVILRRVPGPADAAAVADRIIHAMQTPVRLGGRDHHVQASIGITMFPADGVEMDALLHNADLAMYRAKDAGRGGAAFYNPKMSARGARVADSGLYRAMKRREFSLYFQPQYRVTDGALAGIEALLRWQRPSEGLVTSSEFIPAAEESGLIVDLGSWVIEAACAQIARWRDDGLAPPRLAVNLSVQQMRDPELVPALRRQLERHRVAPGALEFEVNEAALVDPQSQASIAGLSATGVGLTLDDFGTGSTALANLRRYPVGAVKIDRSFVEQVSTDASAAALASTIIVMAHSLQKRVVAEGVETLDQLDYLRENGCDLAQGYFLARPLSANDMTDLLRGRSPQAAVGQSATA